ncbi:hypothetical protein DL93DRAFT_2151418 [Clavulina sp. PMI_390]|nr:hypothetical protein DL93DRAFT_2151418 [Clavulina sp. PMI_390]
MAALADLPRVIFNRVLEQMQSYKISSFLHDMTMAPNGTINNASTTNPLQAAGSLAGERKSKGFLDSSSIYTSGYALGLALMVILINRIQHIVVPPRTAHRNAHRFDHEPEVHDYELGPAGFSVTHTIEVINSLRRRLLPINVKRTRTRLFITLPALLHSIRTLLLLFVSMLHINDVQPPSWVLPSLYKHLVSWSMGMDMYTICWTAFLSACFLSVTGAFLAGLEGRPGSAPSFNLLGYAAVLHSFGSPKFYDASLKNSRGILRPNAHIFFVIFQPLFLATILHGININRRWGPHKLVPTTICSLAILVSTAHQCQPIPIYEERWKLTPLNHQAHFWYSLLTDPRWHPYPTFLTNIIESLIIGVIITTYSLDFLTRLLLSPSTPSDAAAGASLTFPLAPSSWSNAIHSESMDLVSTKDEFQVALVKLCIASLDATNFVGLANEVAVVEGDGRGGGRLGAMMNWLRGEDDVRGRRRSEATVHLGRYEEVVIRAPPPDTRLQHLRGGTQQVRRRLRAGTPAALSRHTGSTSSGGTGLAREIKHVSASTQGGRGGVKLPGVGGFWIDSLMSGGHEVRRLVWRLLAFVRGFGIWIRSFITWPWGAWRRADQDGVASDEGIRRGSRAREGTPLRQVNVRLWEQLAEREPTQFSRAIFPEDDEDDPDFQQASDFDPMSDTSSSASMEDEEDRAAFMGPGSVEEEDSDFDDGALLYSDIAPSEAQILLAHLQARTQQHLTRIQYDPPHPSLSSSSSRLSSALSNQVEAALAARAEPARQLCVICLTEPRVIICWPCRCLSLCDDCRGSLAARSAASKHSCPCCRQNVEGYSRIFIP